MPTATPYLPSIEQTCLAISHGVSTTLYGPLNGSKTPTGTIADHEIKMDRPTTFANMRVYMSAKSIDVGETVVVRLMKNGSDTEVAVTMTPTTSVGWVENLAALADFAIGDTAALKLSRTGLANATIQMVTMERITS